MLDQLDEDKKAKIEKMRDTVKEHIAKMREIERFCTELGDIINDLEIKQNNFETQIGAAAVLA